MFLFSASDPAMPSMVSSVLGNIFPITILFYINCFCFILPELFKMTLVLRLPIERSVGSKWGDMIYGGKNWVSCTCGKGFRDQVGQEHSELRK